MLRAAGVCCFKTLLLATESNQKYVLAIFTAHAQEPVIEAIAFEGIVELLLDKGGQYLSLGFEVGAKLWVMGFDEPPELKLLLNNEDFH